LSIATDTQMAESTDKKTVILDFQVDTTEAVVSIGNLEKANKALREERKKVDLSTEEGVKRVKDINNQINQNTETIKSNSDSLKKNQLNVGNYTESINKSKVGVGNFNTSIKESTPFLDKMSGGLASAAQGFMGMVRSSLAFIATPIGAVIAAVGLALGALMTYFKGSEEGQNRLNKIMAIAGAIMEKITDVVEDMGEAIFNAIRHPWDTIKQFGELIKENIINRFEGALEFIPALGKAVSLLFKGQFAEAAQVAGDAMLKVITGVENVTTKVGNLAKASSEAIAKAAKDGYDLATLQNQLEKDDRVRTEARAKRDLEVSLLRRKADEAEGATKLKYLNEALKLEAISIAAETKTATLRRDIAKEKVRINGDDKEALDELSKAEADLFNAQRGAFDETRKMNKERLATEEALQKAYDDRIKKAQDVTDKEVSEIDKRLEKEKEYTDSFVRKQKEREEKVQKEREKGSFAAIQQAINRAKAEGKIEQDASDQAIENEKKKWEGILKGIGEGIKLFETISNGLFETIQGHYKVQENALAVSLAKQKEALNAQYSEDLKALDQKLATGLITQEEYDAALITLNQKQQADIKAAQIEQAEALNEIKRKEFEANKKNQIAQAVADIAKAVLGAFAGTPGGIIVKGIAAAAAAIFGAIQIRQIEQTEFVPTTFRTGGYTGDGNPDQLAGQVHKSEFVMPADVVAQYGKEHFQSYMDGSAIANASTMGMTAQSQASQAPVYLSYTEFKRFVREVELKESIVKA
jgi:hypothetical protein